jgi:pimeloyl-ACP methyl ester carboxylesterase
MKLSFPMSAPELDGSRPEGSEHWAIIDGVRLRYVDEGRGAPVVCVHGAFADHRNWGPQRALIARSHRYIAYSQRYFGPEPWPDAGERYSQETHVRDLVEFLRALRVAPAYVVARSYGATVALVAALRHPELVRALLVQEPQMRSLVSDPVDQETLREEARSLAAVRTAAESGDEDGATRLFFDWVNGEPGAVDLLPVDAQRFHLANGRTIALHFAAPRAPALSCADLAALSVPLTVTRGEFTRPYMRICAEAVHHCVPGSRLVVIPNARHAPSAQNPAAFNEAIFRFLASH